MEDIFVPMIAIGCIFIAFPWLILHYITKWKQAKTLAPEDENLLDEMFDMARRLEDRVHTVERILSAENPNWRALGSQHDTQPPHRLS